LIKYGKLIDEKRLNFITMHQKAINTLVNQETGFNSKMFYLELSRYEKPLDKRKKAIGD
jgi:hypothetical protein